MIALMRRWPVANIILVANNRAELGPLSSVVAALPDAEVVGLKPGQQTGPPAEVMGFALWWFNREFMERKPSLVIVLGDRYETLSAALAAFYLRVSVAHIHGGEHTAGAWDDSLRDMVTRASVLHFVATESAAYRVNSLQMFPNIYIHNPAIHIVGAPGLDDIGGNSALRDRKLILVTYHPETNAPDYGLHGLNLLLNQLAIMTDYEIIFTGVNNDPGKDDFNNIIATHCLHFPHMKLDSSIPHAGYVALMQEAALVIGNSSAGVIEAPWVGVPSVNIGHRQSGRPMASSVIQAGEDMDAAVRAALSWRGPWEPCYKGGAAPRIVEVVRGWLDGQGVSR